MSFTHFPLFADSVETCLPGVTGESCDECLSGYYNTTDSGCKPCDCNLDGSLSNECDSRSGQCECKGDVTGRRCEACPHRSIGPSLYSVLGCTKCFCNDFSRRCSLAKGWYQAAVSNSFLESSERDAFRSNGKITPNTK